MEAFRCVYQSQRMDISQLASQLMLYFNFFYECCLGVEGKQFFALVISCKSMSFLEHLEFRILYESIHENNVRLFCITDHHQGGRINNTRGVCTIK